AKIIMTGIRKIASTGRTVVCTIHQPSTEVFEMFDNLLLLKRGGETVFFGELGLHAVNMINYFKSIPNTPRLIEGSNPATWMLEVIGAGVETKQTISSNIDFVKVFNESEEYRQMTTEQSNYSIPHPTLPELTYRNKRAASSVTQFKMLTQRFFRMYWRTPSYNNTRLVISVILAVMFGLVYCRVDYSTFTGLTGGIGMIYITSTFISFISFNGSIPLAGQERPSFYRERASQTYNALWYFVGSTLVEIPYVFLSTFVFTIIFYPFVRLHDSVGACILYGFNMSLIVLMTAYVGQLMVYAMPSMELAGLVGFTLNNVFFLFLGYAPTASHIPKAYRWFYTINPWKYAMEVLSAQTFATCTDRDQIGCNELKNVPPSVLQDINATTITVKKYIEHSYEMYGDHLLLDIVILVGFIGLFRLLALISLWYINHQKR
ncbi:ATP-binding Cassette (ABC) Superfamily, partial [Thraustotheca clavata]